MKKQDVAKVIALTLAEQAGAIAPSVTHWGQAKVWADLFEQRRALVDQVNAEEPSYMMFARANARDGLMSTPTVVEALLARIDRLEGK